jgi:hypothetical protein
MLILFQHIWTRQQNGDSFIMGSFDETKEDEMGGTCSTHRRNVVTAFIGEPKGKDRLCGIVLRVPGYRSRGPGSIPGATRFSEK